MDFICRMLFESPIWLGVFSFIAFAVVLLWRRRWTGWAERYGLPLTLAVILVLFVVQSLVVTQREQIMNTLHEFVLAAEQRDGPALGAALSPDYEADGLNRDDVLALVTAMLESVRIQDTCVMNVDLQIDDPAASMILAARATVSIRGAVGELHWGRWRISWRREGDVWRITSLIPEMVDNVPVLGMRELRRIAP